VSLPPTIGENQFSVGTGDDVVYCVQSDDNGNPVYIPPDGVVMVTATAQGQQDGSTIYSEQIIFGV
jgi:hypothetical protein